MAVLALVFAWSYLPVLKHLLSQWNSVDDYSHGFLVIPIAAVLLFARRRACPTVTIGWWGLVLILAAGALRCFAAKYFFDALAGWSIVLWVGGAVLFVFGARVFVWALPSIVFLVFMVPLPYFVETALAQPLQTISAEISGFLLNCMMQPAAVQGSTLLIGEYSLEVARACSGLRITLGVAALAYAFAFLFRTSRVTKLVLAFAVIPIAVLANSIRIVVTALCYQLGLEGVVMRLAHDGAGLLMLPAAALMFMGMVWYLDRLFFARRGTGFVQPGSSPIGPRLNKFVLKSSLAKRIN